MCLACGRSEFFDGSRSPLPPDPAVIDGACRLELASETLDLGPIAPGRRATRKLRVENTGTATCTLGKFEIAASAPGFSSPLVAGPTLRIPPNQRGEIEAAFEVSEAAPPYDRAARLSFETNDLARPERTVDLRARLLHCELQVAGDLVDFGFLAPSGAADRVVPVKNLGDLDCPLDEARLQGDRGFSIVAAPLSVPAGGESTIRVRFTASPELPLERRGNLFVLAREGEVVATVPLLARISACVLTVSPSPLDFGSVALNRVADRTLALGNRGDQACFVTQAFLAPESDPLFSLPSTPIFLQILPGQTEFIRVEFSATDSAPPRLRTGTLLLDTNDFAETQKSVRLSAFINTICDERGQFIYTVDVSGIFARFDPATLTSTPVGELRCPVAPGVTPFSMNVDQSANAWVLFNDGSLFQVDTKNAACRPTPYRSGQLGLVEFGMGSVFDTATGVDTLFIAGGTTFPATQATLARLDLTNFVVSAVGPMDVGSVELAGTGDGQLWAFAAPGGSPESTLDRVDPTTGSTVEPHVLTGITTESSGYAVKFFGGAFYLFVGPDVWRVPRDALIPGQLEPTSPPTRVFSAPGSNVVGAGVSTCAPVGM